MAFIQVENVTLKFKDTNLILKSWNHLSNVILLAEYILFITSRSFVVKIACMFVLIYVCMSVYSLVFQFRSCILQFYLVGLEQQFVLENVLAPKRAFPETMVSSNAALCAAID